MNSKTLLIEWLKSMLLDVESRTSDKIEFKAELVIMDGSPTRARFQSPNWTNYFD